MPMETEEKRYFMVLADNEIYETRTLILAMGVMAAKLLEGEEVFLGRGVSYCATCDGKLYQGKRIAVLCSSEHYEQEVEYLAGLAEKVYYFPTFASTLTGENIIMSKDLPVQVNGGMKVSSLTLRSGAQLEIDGLFCLRNAIGPYGASSRTFRGGRAYCGRSEYGYESARLLCCRVLHGNGLISIPKQ